MYAVSIKNLTEAEVKFDYPFAADTDFKLKPLSAAVLSVNTVKHQEGLLEWLDGLKSTSIDVRYISSANGFNIKDFLEVRIAAELLEVVEAPLADDSNAPTGDDGEIDSQSLGAIRDLSGAEIIFGGEPVAEEVKEPIEPAADAPAEEAKVDEPAVTEEVKESVGIWQLSVVEEPKVEEPASVAEEVATEVATEVVTEAAPAPKPSMFAPKKSAKG